MLVSAIGKLNTFQRGSVRPQNTFCSECKGGKKSVKVNKSHANSYKFSVKA